MTSMTPEERIAAALAFLRGKVDRIEPCGKHPLGHRKTVGENPYEDLRHIEHLLAEEA